MILNSIKWRLQLWYGLMLVAVLTGLGVTAFQLESGRQFRHIDGELQRRLNVLAAALRPPPRPRPPGALLPDRETPEALPGLPPEREGAESDTSLPPVRELRLPGEVALLFDGSDTNGYYFELSRLNGQVLLRSTNAPDAQALPAPSLELEPTGPKPSPRENPETGLRPGQQPPPRGEHHAQMRGNFREVEMITPRGERILVGHNISPELKELRRAALSLFLVGGIILLVGLAGGWWLASNAIRPIDDISATAVKISAGDLSQRINTADTKTELGQLAAVLNSTFERLETTFAQQKQFTADAAHELRTPVSVILTQTQGTLNKERSAAEYRETLEACQRAAQRMRRLIGSLLELARLDAGRETVASAPLDLAQVAREAVALASPQAEPRRIVIHADLQPAPVRGNADQLLLAASNLLSNAAQHIPEGGSVWISTGVENGAAWLTVADNGPGVAEAYLPHLFERFYRVDAARSSHTGGAGLGLAIVKSCVESNGGTVSCHNRQPQGFLVEFHFPAE